MAQESLSSFPENVVTKQSEKNDTENNKLASFQKMFAAEQHFKPSKYTLMESNQDNEKKKKKKKKGRKRSLPSDSEDEAKSDGNATDDDDDDVDDGENDTEPKQKKFKSGSHPGSFMNDETDIDSFVDKIELTEEDIFPIIEKNLHLLNFTQEEGQKLFTSYFDSRKRLRKKYHREFKQQELAYRSDSDDSEGGRSWKRLKARQARKTDLTPSEKNQYMQFPRMPQRCYSLGNGQFITSAGYKDWKNHPQYFKIGMKKIFF